MRFKMHVHVHLVALLTCGVLLEASVRQLEAAQQGQQQQALQAENEPCQPDKLTVYKVVLHTFWSREKFPKHYPDWRPPAQFSKVFGKQTKNSKILTYKNFNLKNI